MGSGDVRVEPVAADDVEEVAALAREVWYDHYPGIITVEQIEYMLRQRYDAALVRSELARDGIWWDKVLADGEMAGFSSYLLTGEPGEMKLDKLYISTRFQRHGFGGMLIARAAETAGRQGCTRLTLAVNKMNRSAIAAYLKHGFHVDGAVVKDIGGGFVMDDYILVRPIGPM